jgi:hypothetical protein
LSPSTRRFAPSRHPEATTSPSFVAAMSPQSPPPTPPPSSPTSLPPPPPSSRILPLPSPLADSSSPPPPIVGSNCPAPPAPRRCDARNRAQWHRPRPKSMGGDVGGRGIGRTDAPWRRGGWDRGVCCQAMGQRPTSIIPQLVITMMAGRRGRRH